MGLLDTIKGVTTTVKKGMQKRAAKKTKEATAARQKRIKSIPLIKKIAREYGAEVEELTTSAHVTKTVKGEERGTHVPYGLSPEEIRNRLDRAFVGSSAMSQVKSAIKTGKKVYKAAKESGLGGGSMWGNPKDLYR